MRIVIALGGNALLRRSQPMTAEVQRDNVAVAAAAIAPLVGEHQVVIAHGNGPQVGLLALEAEAYGAVEPYPLDVLGAETQGMIGYLLEQELGNVLPPEVPLATVLTMTEVDPADPAFATPTKFVGPVYDRSRAEDLARSKGWRFALDGRVWRRVVASPQPRRIFEIRPISWLLERGTVVICAGGGGVPAAFRGNGRRRLVGVEAVIDKDLSSELLAESIGADLFVMATDVDAVYTDWGTDAARRLGEVTPEQLEALDLPAGSMGPKVEAAIRFVRGTGRRAAIGSLADIGRLVAGEAGTSITPAARGAASMRQEAQGDV